MNILTLLSTLLADAAAQLDALSLVAHLLLRLRLGLVVAGPFHHNLSGLRHVAVLVPGSASVAASIGGCDGNEAQ